MTALFRFVVAFTFAFFLWLNTDTPIDPYVPRNSGPYIVVGLLALSFMFLLPLRPRTRRGYEMWALGILVIAIVTTLAGQWGHYFR